MTFSKKLCLSVSLQFHLGIIVCGLLFSSLAFSLDNQDDTQDDQEEMTDELIEEVIVIGTKRNFKPEESDAATKFQLRLVETPQAISIVDSELMRVTASNSFNDIATITAGLVNTDRDISTFNDVSARGFLIDFVQGYKLDGVPIPNLGFSLDFDVIDRVEVVRGPSSIIYGQSDYGSTLNARFKKPQEDYAFAGNFVFGQYSDYGITADVTGALTSDKRLKGRLIISYDDRESFEDISFFKAIAIAPSLLWDISEKTSLEFQGYYQDRELADHAGFPMQIDAAGNVVLPDVPKDQFWGPAWKRSEADSLYLGATLRHEFSPLFRTTLVAAHSKSNRDWQDPWLVGPADEFGTVYLLDFKDKLPVETNVLDFTVTGDFDWFGQNHTYMVNAYLRDTALDQAYFFDFLSVENLFTWDPRAIPESPAPLDPAFTLDATEIGVGGLVLLRPTDRLSIMLGARWSETDQKSEDFGEPNDFKDSDTLPRLGFTFEAIKNVYVYGSYSEGIVYQSARTPDGNLLGPERGEQIEFGAKADLLEGRLGLGLAVFDIDRTNVAAGIPADPTFSRPIDGQTHQGVEFEVLGQPIPGWNIMASYSWLDVKITDSEIPEEIGQQRANTPENMIKLFTTYELLNGPLSGLSFGGGIFWIDEREVDNMGSFQLPSYTRIDLRLGYEWDHWRLGINAKNITDEDILASYSQSIEEGIIYQDYRKVVAELSWLF